MTFLPLGLAAAALALGAAILIRRRRARRDPMARFTAWLARSAADGTLPREVVDDLGEILPCVPMAMSFYQAVRAGRELDEASFRTILTMARDHAREGREGA